MNELDPRSDCYRGPDETGAEPAGPRAGTTPWQAFIAAAQFLTRVPISSGAPASSSVLASAPVFFPLVGALIGLFTAAVTAVGILIWPPWIAVIVALACEAVLTGALHEDAVADFCDAFGGGHSRDDILTILADSRVGAFGALGLFFAVSLRAGALFALVSPRGLAGWATWSSALVASSAWGRYAIVVAMALVPPVVGRESLARSVGSELTGWDLVVSGLWILPATVAFVVVLPIRSLFAAALLAIAVGTLTRLVRSRLGGMTGDCLGCIGFIGQVVVLLGAVARR